MNGKAKLQDEYLSQYFRTKYLSQSSCGHSQDRKDNLRHQNSQPIVQFEENKVSVHSVSSPTLSLARWPRLEQHVETSHTRDNNVETPILSATIEVQDLQMPTYVASTFVQEEELIVEPKQQVFEDT